METRLKGDGLVDDAKAVIQLCELAAHQGKTTIDWKVVGLIAGPKELSQGSLDERRLAGTGTFGRGCQPRVHFL